LKQALTLLILDLQ